jgi:26S proteasome regulatory subunit N2
LARATNWAKLTATASLGVIHRGHEQEALPLMQSYLPRDTGAGAGYSEGGGLYALGLIHANHGAAITDYLLGQLKDAQNEVYIAFKIQFLLLMFKYEYFYYRWLDMVVALGWV